MQAFMKENSAWINYFSDFFTIAYKMSTINPSKQLLTLRHLILFFYCVFYTFLTFCVKKRKKHEIFAHVSSKRIFYCFNFKMQMSSPSSYLKTTTA